MIGLVILMILTFSTAFFSLVINYYALLSFLLSYSQSLFFIKYSLTFLLSLVTTIVTFNGQFYLTGIAGALYGGVTGVSFGTIILRKARAFSDDLKFSQIPKLLFQLCTYGFIGMVLFYGFEFLITYIMKLIF